ncbi:MAG: FAD:protein FMN transferase [Pirellulales bacterium]
MAKQERSTRRDFLRGWAAVDALASAVTGPDVEAPAEATEAAPARRQATPAPLLSLQRRAMACDFEVQLAAGRHNEATRHVLAALDLVEALEDQLSIYRPHTEVMRINREAANGPVHVEPRLFALFTLAAELHAETGGAFDITTGPLSEIWGFSKRAGRMPTDEEAAAALARVGMDGVVLDAARRTVEFRRSGLSLHLNSIGKGYALDRMGELLDSAGVGDYLLHGGRSSVLARGTRPGHSGAGWSIGVPHPLQVGVRLGEIELVNQSLGTSGSGTQFFEHEGRRYGHLLDPRNGRPVDGMYSSTAIAATAAEADALSTAFYVMGLAGTADYCGRHPDVGAILVTVAADAADDERSDGNSSGGVLVSTFGLDAARWQPAESA